MQSLKRVRQYTEWLPLRNGNGNEKRRKNAKRKRTKGERKRKGKATRKRQSKQEEIRIVQFVRVDKLGHPRGVKRTHYMA